jgi:hypothetical protein
MIFFSIGLPCRLTEWCDAVISRLAEISLGPVPIALVDTPEDLGLDLIRSRASHVVAGARKPTSRLRSALVDTHTNFVLVLSDPRLAVADLMQNHGCGLVYAVKFVANSYACIAQFARLDGALVFDAERPDGDAMGMASAIAQHLGLACSQTDIETVIAARPKPEQREDDGVSVWWEGLGADGQSLVQGVLAGYSEFRSTGLPGGMVWDRALFLIGDAPAESATRAIDVTGRSRCLLFGPYISLPPGPWIATATIGFSQELVGAGFTVEIYAGTRLGIVRLQPAREQVMQATIDFIIEDGSDHEVEIRVFSERAAFDGRIVLGSVAIIPQSQTPIGNDQLLAEIAPGKSDAAA